MTTNKEVNIDFDKFLDDLCSSAPVPGGGSVSAMAGALGSALTAMVAKITLKKEDLDEKFKVELEELISESEQCQNRFKDNIMKDATAYNEVLKTYKLPKNTEEEKTERSSAIQGALKHAAEVPMNVVEDAYKMISYAKMMVERGSENAVTDSAVAVSMFNSAARGGRLNVEINLKSIKDEEFKKELMEKLQKIQFDVNKIIIETNEIISKRMSE